MVLSCKLVVPSALTLQHPKLLQPMRWPVLAGAQPSKLELLIRYLLLQQRNTAARTSATVELQLSLPMDSEPAPLLPAVDAFPVQA